MEKYKQNLLKRVKSHIDFVRQKISEKLETAKVVANQSLKGLGKMSPENQALFMNLRGSAHKRVAELTRLEGSPYFIKCEIVDEEGRDKEYFFAKHEFSEQSIYSWVAPISAIRFENPGRTSYRLPNGKTKTVTIKQKETYMIVDGKVLLFSLEAGDKPRELIYQEHFTKQKSEFTLPEIVAQMEKAQDQVVRAGHKGPLAISGPAGSGKTTLALHRVAYLTQVPDTAGMFPADGIIVFVQDNGTRDYFSTLLPSLGINNVQITTFSEWAFKILNLEDCSYIERYGEGEEEKDVYEYQKLETLRGGEHLIWNGNIFGALFSHYSKHLRPDSLEIFNKQKREKSLDRFDLVLLLRAYYKKHKKFEIKRRYQAFVKQKLVKKTEKKQATYPLMIIDEFQNYLPEQIQILKSCLNEKTQSVVYVGDMAQQVKLGTIRRWEEVGESIPPERDIKLNKVYRNTKNILSFIGNLGYPVSLSPGLKDGPPVVEEIVRTTGEEIEYIKKIIPEYKEGSVGILAKEESYLRQHKESFASLKNVHVLTMLEAQGVEFDLVFLVGMKAEYFSVAHYRDASLAHLEERKRMQKDLLYVALTRAITELHILGTEKLSKILK